MIGNVDNGMLKNIERHEQMLRNIIEQSTVVHKCPRDDVNRVYDILGITDDVEMDSANMNVNYYGYYLNTTDRQYDINGLCSNMDTIGTHITGGNKNRIEPTSVIKLCRPIILENKNIIGNFVVYNRIMVSNSDEHFAIVDVCKYCKHRYIYDYYSFGKAKCCVCGGMQ
jgi:hypothetical protein